MHSVISQASGRLIRLICSKILYILEPLSKTSRQKNNGGSRPDKQKLGSRTSGDRKTYHLPRRQHRRTALAVLAERFEASVPQVQWVVLAYLPTAMAAGTGAARMADVYGLRQVLASARRYSAPRSWCGRLRGRGPGRRRNDVLYRFS